MNGTALPLPADLFALGGDRIHRAAADLWPGKPLTLGDHVPSVTGYVHRASTARIKLQAAYRQISHHEQGAPTCP